MCQYCEFTDKEELLLIKMILGTNDIETQKKPIKMGNKSLKIL